MLLCGSVLCFVPPPPRLWNPPPCALVPDLLVGWLLGFGLLDWLLRWLVGYWLIGSGTGEFGWLLGWLVGWLVACLVGSLVRWLVGCWLVARVYVCVLYAHMLCAVAAQLVCV